MVSSEIYIDRPLEEVWDFIVLEFAKSFKCSPKQLTGKTIEIKTSAYSGEIKVKQTIQELQAREKLVLRSETSKDIVTTYYELKADEEDASGTFLYLAEEGKGKESMLRTWNYKLMSFPLLKNRSQKRLRQRLEQIKYLLERDIEQEENAENKSTDEGVE